MHRAHPHIRGEYLSFLEDAGTPLGSPPHTWGISFLFNVPAKIAGLTPTYVGNIHRSIRTRAGGRAHPHIRGEYMVHVTIYCSVPGSPPHTWGIYTTWHVYGHISGLTPTYVGNILTVSPSCTLDRAHPHIRGEYDGGVIFNSPHEGSPPHTWGISSLTEWTLSGARLTPTYVGNIPAWPF